MLNEEKIRNDLNTIDCNTVQQVCDLLKAYNQETLMYLADFVASLCDVTKEELLSDTKKLKNSHARWLYWYAYRYMTNESYETIANKTQEKRKFTDSCVGICVFKMSMMIAQEPIWRKRWIVLKRVVKAILEDNNMEHAQQPPTFVLKVIPPKGIDVKLQVINEK